MERQKSVYTLKVLGARENCLGLGESRDSRVRSCGKNSGELPLGREGEGGGGEKEVGVGKREKNANYWGMRNKEEGVM